MAPALTLLVLGTANFFGTTPNVSSVALVPNTNLTSAADLLMSEAKSKGYVYTPGIGAHKLYMDRSTWSAARVKCQIDGGNLAVIDSIEEAKVITRIIASQSTSPPWIGVQDFAEEGKFVTIDGQSIDDAGLYNIWEAGEPNNAGPNGEDCVVILGNEKLLDDSCEKRFNYVCELRYPQVRAQK